MKKYLFLIIVVATILRFYNLETIPAGLHGDGASQGYNAYSLKMTGQDRYGQNFPILFRSLGSYQPPIYTYLTIIPISIFGNTVFAARFVSALSGVILIFVTFLFLEYFFKKKLLSLLATTVLAITPWAVNFSRLTIEANLGLLLFVISIILFTKSLEKISLFTIACIILGFSTHAYYSERLISLLFLPLFIFLFRKELLKEKKWIIVGIIFFLITQIPHLYILQTGALTRRFDQVSYFNGQQDLINMGKLFISSYLNYFSPKNLFLGIDTFYTWCFIPFLLGLRYVLKNQSSYSKILLLLFVIAPIPAALTGDVFYSLRVLVFLWIVTLITSIGVYRFSKLIGFKFIKIFALILIVHSLFSLYTSYFILFKYEKAHNFGYSYIKLSDKLNFYNDKEITIDSGRDPGIGIRMAYLLKYDPLIIQQQLKSQLKSPYYSSNVDLNEIYKINNVTIKPIDWSEDCNRSALLIGDEVAISDSEVEKHHLKKEFEILDLSGKTALRGFSTLPQDKCLD